MKGDESLRQVRQVGGNMPNIVERNKVFSTQWFDVIAKTVDGEHPGIPYYSLQMPDYVSIVALTERKEVLLVRQYRPTVEGYTLELPSGHVDEGESPAEAARRELLEETGYQAIEVELLGCLLPDTGRLSNRMWCYFSSNVKPCRPAQVPEVGIELIICNQSDLIKHIVELQFDHALHLAAILLAILKHKLQ